MRTILLALVFAILATPALASDGVLEINQTCAIDTGCFPGDTPGFPITITTRGSYRLTGNLTLPDENTTGIDIQTPYVDLDLGGFSIVGPVTCSTSGEPPRTTCSATGTGWGVLAGLPAAPSARVRNGVVSGVGFFGVGVGALGSIEDIRAIENGTGGILAGGSVRIEGCNATLNGGNGVQGSDGVHVIDTFAWQNRDNGVSLQRGAMVRGVHAEQNFGRGIFATANANISNSSTLRNGNQGIVVAQGSTVTTCTAAENATEGIIVDPTSGLSFAGGATISGNTAHDNGTIGIAANSGSTVSGNTAFENGSAGILGGRSTISGNTAYENGGSGITAFASAVRGNTVSFNTGFGLQFFDQQSGYRENVIIQNSAGTVELVNGPDVVNLGDNACNGSSTCP